MRLILLTSVVMIAFAANSILNRLAVNSGSIDPGSFAVVRVLSGALILSVLVLLQGGQLQFWLRRRLVGGSALSLYLVGFSLAYLTLDAGAGALILFGVVQIVMFSVTSLSQTPPTGRQFTGALVAFSGLAWVLWPGEGALVNTSGAVLMGLAGIGWGIYSLVGRYESDALSGTAANFIVAFPITTVCIALISGDWVVTPWGIGLAVLSGAVTSGLGYALWYRVLPQLVPAVAGTVQLSVPVIALFVGALLLGEKLSWPLIAAAALVLGGIALATTRPKR